MLHRFGALSTADEVLDGFDLSDRRVLVTGVSAGIGAETARALLARGATVIGTARDPGKNAAMLRAAAISGCGRIEIATMDLSDLPSVRAFAADMAGRGEPLDVVIANAGVMNTPFRRTANGFELQFATNFLGHFLLANLLLPLMRNGARLVVLSSSGHRFADVNLTDPNFETTPYDPVIAYGRSKTADALLAVAFDARHRGRGVRAAAVHPGNIWTELARYVDPAAMADAVAAMQAHHVALGNPPFEPKTLAQGAATTLWAGFRAQPEVVGGRYCEDCGVAPILESADVSIFTPGVLPYAVDGTRADALWAVANGLLGEHF